MNHTSPEEKDFAELTDEGAELWEDYQRQLEEECYYEKGADDTYSNPQWNARLASRMAAVVTAAKRGTIALGLVFSALSMAYAEGQARELPLVPTDGECALIRTYEDTGALAQCGHEMWVYDPDGNNPPESVGYTGPRWDAGWYPCVDSACAVIDHNVTQ